jgi:hypothetical protein
MSLRLARESRGAAPPARAGAIAPLKKSKKKKKKR